MSGVVLELPMSVRGELKAPLGPVYTDTERLLTGANEPLVTVGDVVTYHVLKAGTTPAVAFVDEKTEREAVGTEIRTTIGGFDREVTVDNPSASLTAPLLDALRDGLSYGGTTLIRVEGEEDLAALPAILAVPESASVIYGQPGEGMVLVTAGYETKTRVRGLVERMDGDVDGTFDILGL